MSDAKAIPATTQVSDPARKVSSPRAEDGPVGSAFGANLEPVIRRHCEGRLSRISWFRTDWQRGGALTGYATYRDDHDVEQPVVVKFPIPPVERRWLVQLNGSDVSPRVYAHGEELGGYDMAWIVMERLPFGPLSIEWGARAFDLLIDAMVRFAAAARCVPVTGEVRLRDYEAIREEARDNVHRHSVQHEQRWNRVLKKCHHQLRDWINIWNDRDTQCWCHGDIHPGNALTRCAPPDGPAILIDMAQVHRGHWIEDAVHLEHLYWARREKLEGRKICKLLARQRKAGGLAVDENWTQLAAIQRCFIAMSTPAILRHMGDPLHVQAALEVLEAQLGT